MISRIVIQLRTQSKESVNYNVGSALQGVLMNVMDGDYATKMHEQKLNPYSQYFYRCGKRMYWVINTLTEEARQYIISPFLENKCGEFFIKHKSKEFVPSVVAVKDINYEKLNKKSSSSYIEVDFVTPTAFKSKGEYTFMPDVKLILNSLINKYKTFHQDVDEEMVENLNEKVKIIEYDIKSAKFGVEGRKIPAFMGSVKFNISKCTPEEKDFVHMLFNFGEYCGIGIKTSMGMGAICIKK